METQTELRNSGCWRMWKTENSIHCNQIKIYFCTKTSSLSSPSPSSSSTSSSLGQKRITVKNEFIESD